MKQLNIAVLIEYNTISELVEELYNEVVVEEAKLKKEFELDTPEKFTYSNWRKQEKSIDNDLSTKFNLRGVPLIYVIMRDEVPETVNFTDKIYEYNPEH